MISYTEFIVRTHICIVIIFYSHSISHNNYCGTVVVGGAAVVVVTNGKSDVLGAEVVVVTVSALALKHTKKLWFKISISNIIGSCGWLAGEVINI